MGSDSSSCVTSNFHEFGFGLAHREGHLYGTLAVCILNGGKSCLQQTPDRGKVFRVALASGAFEIVASGLRTPNGIAATPDGGILVADNQGDWLPSSKIVAVEPGDFFGEAALLSSQPRSATCRARTPADCLELSRAALATILTKHPRVSEVMEEFNDQRSESTIDSLIDSLGD